MGISECYSLISCSDCVEWWVILSRIAFDCVVQPYSERCYPTWAPRIFLTPSNSSSSKKSWIVTFYCYEPLLRLNDGWMQNRILCSVQIWHRECHDKHKIDYSPQLTIRNRILLSQKNYCNIFFNYHFIFYKILDWLNWTPGRSHSSGKIL